ncbi:hypothetical protein SUDANB37_03375 [Streptomyces sp. enrichment culture]
MHAVALVLVVCGALLVVRGRGSVPAVAVGVFLLALAWTLRPRLGALRDDLLVLYREDAPRLYALIDEVAKAADTRGVDAVPVDAEVNASVTVYNLRRRRVLTAPAQVGPHARLPRPLLHQDPRLVHHPRRPPGRPRRLAPPHPTTLVLAHWAYKRHRPHPHLERASPPSSTAARHASRR